ncbi:hypothetical protein ACFPCW_09195 [Vibrio thalassae]
MKPEFATLAMVNGMSLESACKSIYWRSILLINMYIIRTPFSS